MNEQEIKQAAELLQRLEPGYVPYPIFEQIARIAALPILEIIPLRMGERGIEVLLLNREPDDRLFPDTVHTPGTVIRATDLNAEGRGEWPALQRVLLDELLGASVGPTQYVGNMLHESKRGVEQAQLYYVEVLEEPPIGVFYPVTDLPDNLIQSQLKFIKLAAEQFSRVQPQ